MTQSESLHLKIKAGSACRVDVFNPGFQIVDHVKKAITNSDEMLNFSAWMGYGERIGMARLFPFGMVPIILLIMVLPINHVGNGNDGKRGLFIAIPGVETTDWRVVCGRTTSTVRRKGRLKPSLPLFRCFPLFFPGWIPKGCCCRYSEEAHAVSHMLI